MKLKNQAESFKEFVIDQCGASPELFCRPMFGGHGLYQGDIFFGIIHKGRLYFKTNAFTRVDYAAYDMMPFTPNETQTLKNYLEVPVSILEDSTALRLWAKKAVAVSL